MPKAANDVAAVLHRFDILPARNCGKVVEVEFKRDTLYTVDVRECDAVNVSAGATMSCSVRLEPGGENSSAGPSPIYTKVYFSDALAEEALAIDEGALIKVRARTAYGVEREEWNPDAYKQEHKGLVVDAILAVTTPPPS